MNDPYRPPGPPTAGYAPSPYAPTTSGPSEVAIDFLRQTRPWVAFISVMCFIAAGLMLLGGIFMMIAGAVASAAPAATKMPFPMAALGLIYLPLSALYIYPGLKLWQYGAAIARLVGSRSTADLESALLQQKSFWKYAGIATIVLIVTYVLVIIGAVIAGVAGALGGAS